MIIAQSCLEVLTVKVNSKMCKIIIQDKSAASMPPAHSLRTCKICGGVLCDKSFTF